jgi:hypothetical protein
MSSSSIFQKTTSALTLRKMSKLRRNVSATAHTRFVALTDDLAHKIARAEFSLRELRQLGSGTPEHAIAIETHFASVLASLRSIAQYMAKYACGWKRLDAWLQAQPSEDQVAWRALGDLRNDDIHNTCVLPHRVRRGGHFHNHFGPDFVGNHFGGNVVHEVAHALRHEVVEFSDRCIALMKRLLVEFSTLAT